MKKGKLLAILLTATALGLASCNQNNSLPEPQNDGTAQTATFNIDSTNPNGWSDPID